MFGLVTTVAVIALGQAIARPTSKEDGWKLSPYDPALHQVVRLPTEAQILQTGMMELSTESSSFLAADRSMSRLEWLRSELRSYSSLADGWDGEGSVSADPRHVDAASNVLGLLPAGIPLPVPMLSHDGELGLYWKGEKWLADAVIEEADRFSLFIRFLDEGNREVYIESIPIDSTASAIVKDAFSVV